MKVGYARISTPDQKLDLQEDALKLAGCEVIYKDIASGSKNKRSGLDEALNNIYEGDMLVVWKLDRLGRSLQHLIETVKKLDNRKIGFRSLQESIDTTTSGGKLIFHIFGALAEFERDLIIERTNAGLKAAKARGINGGRPIVVTPLIGKRIVDMYNRKTISVVEICRRLGICRTTFYNYINTVKDQIT